MNSDRIGLTKKITVGICGDAKLVAQQLLMKLSKNAGDNNKLCILNNFLYSRVK